MSNLMLIDAFLLDISIMSLSLVVKSSLVVAVINSQLFLYSFAYRNKTIGIHSYFFEFLKFSFSSSSSFSCASAHMRLFIQAHTIWIIVHLLFPIQERFL